MGKTLHRKKINEIHKLYWKTLNAEEIKLENKWPCCKTNKYNKHFLNYSFIFLQWIKYMYELNKALPYTLQWK